MSVKIRDFNISYVEKLHSKKTDKDFCILHLVDDDGKVYRAFTFKTDYLVHDYVKGFSIYGEAGTVNLIEE